MLEKTIEDRRRTPRRLIAALGAFASLALTACGSLTANAPGAPGAVPQGQGYYVPKVEMIIEVSPGVGDTVNPIMNVSPRYVGDVSAGQFHLVRTPGALSADITEIKVDDDQLLSAVTVNYDSRAAEIAALAGKIAGRFESGFKPGVAMVSDVFDPTSAQDLQTTGDRVTSALQDWARNELVAPESAVRPAVNGAAAAAQAQAASEAEKRAARRKTLERIQRTRVGFEWEWAGTAPNRVAAPCEGICTRTARPGRLRIFRCEEAAACGAAKVLVGTYSISIPNGAPVDSIPVNGGIFADIKNTITLSHGMVTTQKVETGSEVEGALTSAVDLITNTAQSAIDGLTSDKGRVEADTALRTAETANLEAQGKLLTAQGALTTQRSQTVSDPAAAVRREAGLQPSNSEGFIAGLFGPTAGLPTGLSSSGMVPPPTTQDTANPKPQTAAPAPPGQAETSQRANPSTPATGAPGSTTTVTTITTTTVPATAGAASRASPPAAPKPDEAPAPSRSQESSDGAKPGA